MKKTIKTVKPKTPSKSLTPITQKELKQAYSLVTQDLFNSLVKAKTEQTVHIGPLGSFGSLKKTEAKQKCGWDKNIYIYYRFKFTPSAKLKRELNKVLEKKYR